MGKTFLQRQGLTLHNPLLAQKLPWKLLRELLSQSSETSRAMLGLLTMQQRGCWDPAQAGAAPPKNPPHPR